jgi:hypothetical protein
MMRFFLLAGAILLVTAYCVMLWWPLRGTWLRPYLGAWIGLVTLGVGMTLMFGYIAVSDGNDWLFVVALCIVSVLLALDGLAACVSWRRYFLENDGNIFYREIP